MTHGLTHLSFAAGNVFFWSYQVDDPLSITICYLLTPGFVLCSAQGPLCSDIITQSQVRAESFSLNYRIHYFCISNLGLKLKLTQNYSVDHLISVVWVWLFIKPIASFRSPNLVILTKLLEISQIVDNLSLESNLRKIWISINICSLENDVQCSGQSPAASAAC